MSDIAKGLLSLAEDLRFEMDYRRLCPDEREAVEKTERIIAQILGIDEDMQQEARHADAA